MPSQAIIPGAAYLHTNLEEVFIERKGELMNSKGRFWLGELHNFVLLYAPGDKVVQMEDIWADLNLNDFEAGSGGTKHGTVTKIYRER